MGGTLVVPGFKAVVVEAVELETECDDEEEEVAGADSLDLVWSIAVLWFDILEGWIFGLDDVALVPLTYVVNRGPWDDADGRTVVEAVADWETWVEVELDEGTSPSDWAEVGVVLGIGGTCACDFNGWESWIDFDPCAEPTLSGKLGFEKTGLDAAVTVPDVLLLSSPELEFNRLWLDPSLLGLG